MFRSVILAMVATLVCLPLAARSKSPDVTPDGSATVTLKIDAHHHMTLNGKPVSNQNLVTALSRVTAGDHEHGIIVRSSANMRFDEMEALLHRLRKAGYAQVAIRPMGTAAASRR